MFSMAMTAWSAKVVEELNLLAGVNGWTSCRLRKQDTDEDPLP